MMRHASDMVVLMETHQLLSTKEIELISAFHDETGQCFMKIVLNYGYLSRKRYYQMLDAEGYTCIAVREQEVDAACLALFDFDMLLDSFALPLRIENNTLLVAMCDPLDIQTRQKLSAIAGMPLQVLVAEDLDITWMLHKHMGEARVKHAVYHLVKTEPETCALVTFTNTQLLAGAAMVALISLCLYVNVLTTLIVLNVLLSVFFVISVLFKFFLVMAGSRLEVEERVSKSEVRKLKNQELPVFTILLPVYKESEIIKKLVWNLQSLDYPRHKLDIKLLIEEDDSMTLEAVRGLDFPAVFDMIVVPFHQPKTKPKACNYGLLFTRGTYLTIYDAEDIPDSDQLKKVVAMFAKLPEHYICIQCALNYFNRNENLLTRMFTLEYSYWFDYMLPGLDKLDIPIPLGGTSNHFKTARLIELGGWDAFNVTEDADLGLRAYAKGYKVSILNSTTYEEANNETFNWIRQRSRWIKGYMQTYLVHMRNPYRLWRKVGTKGFLGFQFFIGGTSFTFLMYPVLLLMFIAYIVFKLTAIDMFFPDWVLHIANFNLIVGNLVMIYSNMIAVFKRRMYDLIVFALVNPLYWLLHSIAAYKGLGQLINKPFYWEKTQHGLTKSGNHNT